MLRKRAKLRVGKENRIIAGFSVTVYRGPMINVNTHPLTEIVDGVARDTLKAQFRGNVFGQHGMHIDRYELRHASDSLVISEYIDQAKKLRAYVQKNGPVKF